MTPLASTILIGTGATALIDLWAIVRRQLLGIAPPAYGLVGRWLALMLRGHFRHDSIATAPPVHRERLIGWMAHYLIGIGFALLLVGLAGAEWLGRPTIWPALATGLGTVAAPFLVMQPAMGAGVAASRTARPASARLQSVVTHIVFGLGLYLWAQVLVALNR